MRWIALVLVAAAAVAACGDDSDEGATATTAATAAAATSEPAMAERIVPVNGDLAEVVYALGLGDQVVATDISATYPPEAAATPKIGYQRTLVAETILSFEPTVVLADDNAGPPEVLDQLRAAGVRVVDVPKQTDLDAPAAKIRAVAGALGVPERGEELVAGLDADLAAAKDAAEAAVARSGRPKVLALYLRGDAVQLTFGEGSGVDAVIEAAGGTDVGTEMGVVGHRPAVDREHRRRRAGHPPRDDDGAGVGRRRRRARRPARPRPHPGSARTGASSPSRTSTSTASGRAPASSSASWSSSSTPDHPHQQRGPSMRTRTLTALTLAAALALVACGGDDDDARRPRRRRRRR